MAELFFEVGADTLKLAPILFLIYMAVELVEHRLSHRTMPTSGRAINAGPVLGAFLGVLPQCGFSVASSCLYSEGLITSGTLLATFISTSDEALPVLLAQAGATKLVAQIIGIKLLIAIVVGYAADMYFARPAGVSSTTLNTTYHCTSRVPCESSRGLIKASLSRTLKIMLLTFCVSLAVEMGIAGLGREAMGRIFLEGSPLQPIVTAIFGLVPSCGVSVAIAEFFLKGTISFGSAISGLCSSSGMGILVLAKENKDHRDTVRIILTLLSASIVSGLVIELL